MTDFITQHDTTQPFSNQTAQFGLAAATALSYTVPGDNRITYNAIFRFAPAASVWVGLNVTATLPVSNSVTSNSAIVLNPTSKYVRGGDVLSFQSTSIVADVGIELFKLPG